MSLAIVAQRLDAFVERVGRLTSWLTLLLVVLVAANVLTRYFLHVSSVAFQELEWHLLAVLSLLGASYTLQQREHVRVDIFYERYSPRLKQLIEALVSVLIVVPVTLFVAYLSFNFAGQSLAMNEGSPDPGGLGFRYLLKAFIPLGFALITLQGLAMMLSAFADLRQTASE